MSDIAVLNKPNLSESSRKAKDVREQLRALESTLRALSAEVAEGSPAGGQRLTRARLSVKMAVDELPCTDTSQLPF